MGKFRSILEKSYKGISYVSVIATLFAMMVTTIDVILALTTSKRILGNTELVEFAMLVMLALTLGKTQLEDGHVRVDMFVNKFPPKFRCIFDGCVQLCCLIFCVLMAVQTFKQIGVQASRNISSTVLNIPYAPFYVILFIGFILYAAAILLKALEYFAEVPNAKPVERI